MFTSSITKFLIASLTTLMTGLLIAALILALEAWSHYALSGRTARLTSTDKTLFDALVAVRAQIPKDSTALISEDDPRSVIGQTYQVASRTVATALDELESADIPNRSELAAAIRSAWRKVMALQATVNTEAARARAERNLHSIDEWRTAIHGTLDALSAASVAIGNILRIGDPLIAEMVQIRRTAWTIRDRYGLQCSMLRSNVDISQPLDPQQLDSWIGNRAVYTFAWHTLDEFLLRPGVSASVRDLVDRARKTTEQAQARVDAIVSRFDGSGRPAVASAEWTTLCDGPFDSILAIAQQAQEEANQHADAIRASSFRILLVAAAELAAVIAFGVFAVVNVQRRLARPMKIVTAAIARLSRRDFDEPVPSTGRPDELVLGREREVEARGRRLSHRRAPRGRSSARASPQRRTGGGAAPAGTSGRRGPAGAPPVSRGRRRAR